MTHLPSGSRSLIPETPRMPSILPGITGEAGAPGVADGRLGCGDRRGSPCGRLHAAADSTLSLCPQKSDAHPRLAAPLTRWVY